ncbi:hypothetical protein [Streptomyces sp. NPDC093568]|uniref:hypothetical protein n=1 Tax=Streptomyces sp. NPDC093568 TaxID=3366041 RepID=UPI0037FC85FF
MTLLKPVLAKVVMDLIVTIRSADPGGIDPDDALQLTEGAERTLGSGLADASDEERHELVRLFRENAEHEGVPGRRAVASEFAEAMHLAVEEHGEDRRTPVALIRVLAKAAMDLLLLMELADDDIIDPDDAVKITEWASGDLRAGLDQASEEDRQELIGLFRDFAAAEEDPERRELALEFPEAMGLVPEH